MKPGGGIRLARLLHARTNDALEILLLSHRDLLRPVREHPPPAAKPSNEGPQVPNPRVCPPLPPHRAFAWERPQEVRRWSPPKWMITKSDLPLNDQCKLITYRAADCRSPPLKL